MAKKRGKRGGQRRRCPECGNFVSKPWHHKEDCQSKDFNDRRNEQPPKEDDTSDSRP